MRTRGNWGQTEGPWGRQRGPGEDRGNWGTGGGLAGGKGLRQRQGNTEGPGKDYTKLGIFGNDAQTQKNTLLAIFPITVIYSNFNN